MLDPNDFFDLAEFTGKTVFADTEYVWDGLKNLKSYMDAIFIEEEQQALIHDRPENGIPLSRPLILHKGKLLNTDDCVITYGNTTKGGLLVMRGETKLAGASVIMAGVVLMGTRIRIGNGVLIESGALIKEPAIIDDQTEVRQGAYLRGYCLVGKRCVIGHSTEVKHSIFLDDAKAGHFNYLGDSILGNEVNLGAGTKFANLRFLPGNVRIKIGKESIDSGLRKFGAILGDKVQTGCNSVTNPGTLIARKGILMPNTTATSGYHRKRSVIR